MSKGTIQLLSHRYLEPSDLQGNNIVVFGDNTKDKKKGLGAIREGNDGQAEILKGKNHPLAYGVCTCSAPGKSKLPESSTKKIEEVQQEIRNEIMGLLPYIKAGKNVIIPANEYGISVGMGIAGFDKIPGMQQFMNEAVEGLAKAAGIENFKVPVTAKRVCDIPKADKNEARIAAEPLKKRRKAEKGTARQNEIDEVDQLSPAEKEARIKELWDAFARGGMKPDELEATIEELKKFPQVANNPEADKAFDKARRIVKAQTQREIDAEYAEASKLTDKFISNSKAAIGLGVTKDATKSISDFINPFDVKDPEWKKCQALLIIFIGPIWGLLKAAEKLESIGIKESTKAEKKAADKLDSQFGIKEPKISIAADKAAAAAAAAAQEKAAAAKAAEVAKAKTNGNGVLAAEKLRNLHTREATRGVDPRNEKS
jgi:hypothetical protein